MRKFEALIDEFGLDDGGDFSFTFEVQSLKKGKIYNEHTPWKSKEEGTVPSGHVIDDNGCWNKIGTDGFNKKFKEIT